MAGQRQPVDLLLIKGKKHLTKQEISERKKREIKAPSDKVRPPAYLSPDLKKEFNKIAKELVRIGIMTNLDVDALARFVFARKMYLGLTDALFSISPTEMVEYTKTDREGNVVEEETKMVANESYSELLLNQDKLFKQCRQAAGDLGLTISSRCRLVIPTKEDDKPKGKEEKLLGDRL